MRAIVFVINWGLVYLILAGSKYFFRTVFSVLQTAKIR